MFRGLSDRFVSRLRGFHHTVNVKPSSRASARTPTLYQLASRLQTDPAITVPCRMKTDSARYVGTVLLL